MKLKQLLKVTDPNQRVHVEVYAFGIFYASTVVDGMQIETLLHIRKDILDARVTFVLATTMKEDNSEFTVLHIQVELCE